MKFFIDCKTDLEKFSIQNDKKQENQKRANNREGVE